MGLWEVPSVACGKKNSPLSAQSTLSLPETSACSARSAVNSCSSYVKDGTSQRWFEILVLE
jgi:hypothetical protein